MAALLVAAGNADAQSFNTIYGFGDSYADTNAPGDPGGIFPGAFPPSAPLGRFSDGLNFVDRLQANFGIGQAVNFAFGGAMTDQNNVATGGPPGFQTEIDIVEALDQQFGPNDIIALSIGGNNANAILVGAVPLGPDPVAGGAAYAALSASQVGDGVQELVDRGARTIPSFAPGAPIGPDNLTLYPARGIDPTSAVGIGATSYLANFAVAVENEFAAIAAQGVRVNFFNFTELQRRVLIGGEADRFGFFNVDGVPDLAADPTSVPCNPPATLCNPANAAGYFYWDGVHLTEAAYNLAADFMTIQLVQNETIPVAAELADIQARNFTETLSQRLQARRDGAVGYGETYSTKDIADPKRLSWKDEPAPVRDDSFALFVSGGFGGGERDDRPGAVGFDYDLRNIVVGGEWKAQEHTWLGAAIGYTNATADYGFLRGFGETELDSVNIGAYASLAYPNWFADLTLAYAINSYDLSRTGVVLPETMNVLLDTSGDTDGHSFVADFRTGYLFRNGAFGFGPIGGLSYSHVSVDGYSETGDSLLTMNVEEQTLESLIGSIGVQLRYKGDSFEPYIAVTLEKEFLDDRSYQFALTSADLVVNTIDIGGDNDPYGRVRAGVKAHFSDALSGSIDGNATFGRETGDDYAVTGTLKYRF